MRKRNDPTTIGKRANRKGKVSKKSASTSLWAVQKKRRSRWQIKGGEGTRGNKITIKRVFKDKTKEDGCKKRYRSRILFTTHKGKDIGIGTHRGEDMEEGKKKSPGRDNEVPTGPEKALAPKLMGLNLQNLESKEKSPSKPATGSL